MHFSCSVMAAHMLSMGISSCARPTIHASVQRACFSSEVPLASNLYFKGRYLFFLLLVLFVYYSKAWVSNSGNRGSFWSPIPYNPLNIGDEWVIGNRKALKILNNSNATRHLIYSKEISLLLISIPTTSALLIALFNESERDRECVGDICDSEGGFCTHIYWKAVQFLLSN